MHGRHGFRSVDSQYAAVYPSIDALVVKIRDQGKVENKAVHIVVGVDLDGHRDVLGLWVERTEGAKFWSSVLTDLKHRGVDDILILCADGLTGLPAAVEANFPRPSSDVHRSGDARRLVQGPPAPCGQDLRSVYTASNAEQAAAALDAVEEKWGKQYPQARLARRDVTSSR